MSARRQKWSCSASRIVTSLATKALSVTIGNLKYASKRALQNPPEFDRLLGSIREHIEGTFHCIQNTGRNIERLLAKTIHGLSTRVILKVTCLVLKHLLRRNFGIDVQSFQVLPT